jgi:hypothetical protein
MPTDLLTRARSAVTVEEECDVIDDYAAGQAIKGLAPENLLSLTEDVRYGLYPRSVLFGVVAALVPEGARWVKTATGTGPAEGRRLGVYMPARHDKELHSEVVWSEGGGTDALALLIAIMEAGNVEA